MDESGIKEIITPRNTTHFFCHERLSIVNPESGSQPLTNEDGTITVCVNGEIYNHLELREGLKNKHTFKTKSDCEIILHLYEEIGMDVASKLNGDFAFVLYDSNKDLIVAARDIMGVVPLYISRDVENMITREIWFSSEMKTFDGRNCELFPPGVTIIKSKASISIIPFLPQWLINDEIPSLTIESPKILSDSLTESVKRRLMTDVPFAVCLSGGLDSSLIASITKRLLPEGSIIPSFCIGLEGSPDLKAARLVANFLQTDHHEFHFTVQDGIDALRDVIYHTETYDVTTIRASTPMYLLGRHIRSLGYKMILSGEGADEIFGGYLYFHKAPNAAEFHKETIRKLRGLHQYDCLRANKSMMAWGVETRVPFLDKDFLDIAMTINPEHKLAKKNVKTQLNIEKFILRDSFDTPDHPYLPDEILWRQKEQFSDGVGYGWIDGLKDYSEKEISDSSLDRAVLDYDYNTPITKEGYLYRKIFEELFGKICGSSQTVPGGPSIACSTAAAVEWDISFKNKLDPSGRSVGIHLTN
jgi:asparagine synthase (glutamine-hydrolysing)